MPDISILAVALPENIEKAKWAGDFAFAQKLIDTRLAGDCTQALRERLLLEKDRLERIDNEYPYTREEALKLLHAMVPDFSDAEMDAFDLDDSADFIYKKGERYYHCDFADSLLKMHPDLGRRGGRIQTSSDTVGACIREMIANGGISRRFRMRASLRVKDGYFVPGETYTVHLPIPAAAAQISDIVITKTSHTPYRVGDENAPQRTVCFRETLTENTEFFVEYEFTNTMRVIDGYEPPENGVILYPDALPVCADDLRELPPHIRFSKYLRMLAEELRGDETDPFVIARNYYDYITCHMRYSYLRGYALYDDLADYAALDLRGDCGVQALFFIALCRISGIPARWQSGLTCEPDDAGCHDWAQFYTEKYGWLFADCSFGGGGRRRGDEQRRRFYFGNLDVYRMVANREYQAEFDPPRTYWRRDPFDSQTGECETAHGPMNVNGFERHMETLDCRVPE